MTVIAARGAAVLRHARSEDLQAIDELTVAGYAPIQQSFESMIGADIAAALQGERWDVRKCRQNRRLFDEHPEQVWVLDDGSVFGFVTFFVDAEVGFGRIDNNAVAASHAGRGWATFMYRHVLDHFRSLDLPYAHVDTGLDAAHDAARRAYEAVGFDRKVPLIDYWQDLRRRNPGSSALDRGPPAG